MRVVQLITDNRDALKERDKAFPFFGTAPEALLQGFSDLPEMDVHVISCTQKLMAAPTKLAENIWFHSLLVPKWGWLRSGYLGCIRAVQKKLRQIQPDLVHAQGTERDCAISAVFASSPKVLTIHGNVRTISKLHRCRPFSFWWLQAKLEAFCLPKFDGVICISNYTQNLVSALAQKTWLLPNAVDKRFFEIRRQKPGGRANVLVVANVDRRKNQINLIMALDQMAKAGRFSLRFFGNCGTDPYGLEFLRLIRARQWCFWGGMVDRETLRTEFAYAAALILPTQEDNCPMVVLEAQAAGVPVIASRVGGLPDLIIDGLTGILVKPDFPDTFSKALQLLLDNPQLAERISQEARLQSLSRFQPKIIAQGHRKIYQEILKLSSRS